MTGSTSAAPRLARYAPGGAMAPHSHPEPWFCVVLRGSYEERIQGATHLHRGGDMLFCPAEADHAQRFGPAGVTKLLFSPSNECLRYLEGHRLPLADAPSVRAPSVLAIGASLARELALDDPHSRLATEGLVLELIAAFARAQAPPDAAAPPWLRRVREMLEDGESGLIALSALAAQAGRHPVHVAREFRRHYGRTVGDYLREKRAARAALLLRSGTLPLTEIALECGYGGSAAFSRAFKAVFGLTPSAYRAAAR